MCVVFILLNREVLYPALTGKPFPSRLPTTLLYVIPMLGFWLFFVQRRIKDFLRHDRLEQLAVIPRAGDALWPALCTAPGLGVFMLLLADYLCWAVSSVARSVVESPDKSIALVRWASLGQLAEGLLESLIFSIPTFVISAMSVWGVSCHAIARAAPALNFLNLIWQSWIGCFLVVTPVALIQLSGLLGFALASQFLEFGTTMRSVLVLVFLCLGGRMSIAATKAIVGERILDLRQRMSPEKLWRDRQAALDARHRERDARMGDS